VLSLIVMSNDATAAASVGGLEALPVDTRHRSEPASRIAQAQAGRPASFALWLLCIATCYGVQQWMYLAASIGTFCTALLLFLLPTMLYFRMTLPTDYQQSPIIFGMLPNRLYMTIIQVLGIVLLTYNVLGIIIFIILHMHIIQENSK
jgi:hypothetical protein